MVELLQRLLKNSLMNSKRVLRSKLQLIICDYSTEVRNWTTINNDVIIMSWKNGSRVEDIDGYVHKIWDEEQVALWTSSPTLSTEGLLVGKS